ncbi:MAG TPA: nicotinate-nucleotide adenylyltransferase [Pyrinomonadaceae bacterium]
MTGARRIALYGGSFDPVHLGHLTVARSLTELFALDEVLFIPAHVAPHKRGRRVAPALDRHAMLALATQDEPRFRISTVELDAPERPYTVETLAHFCEAASRDASRLFFVMGADSWEEITTWREWERVLGMASTIVVTRPGHELEVGHVTPSVRERIVDLRGADVKQAAEEVDADGVKIFFTDAADVDISSTAIRRGAAGRGGALVLENWVAPEVAEYIRKYGLYREVHGTESDDSAGTETAHEQEG